MLPYNLNSAGAYPCHSPPQTMPD